MLQCHSTHTWRGAVRPARRGRGAQAKHTRQTLAEGFKQKNSTATSSMKDPAAEPITLRRDLLLALLGIPAAATLSVIGPVPAAAALPLAPLGRVGQHVGGDKKTGLQASEVAAILERDLRDRQYFVTGDLTPEVFADDCRFVDPTNDISGLSRYMQALRILFDPEHSSVQLQRIQAVEPRRVEAEWTLGGYLRFPWHPYVEPFQGRTVYELNDDGLVQTQRQEWSKSGTKALLESFTPTFGPPR